jgi:hypothetical protein
MIKSMKQESKDYLIKTLLSFVLIGCGAWGIKVGGTWNTVFGIVLFLTGIVIGVSLYGSKFDFWN